MTGTTPTPERTWSPRWPADAHACLAVLDGRNLLEAVAEMGELSATVVGQDLEQDEDDGRFRIARG